MSFSRKDFDKLLRLCAIKLEWEKKEEIYLQLDKILEFVSKLEEVDTENIEPLYHPIEDKILQYACWVEQFKFTEDILKNVKHSIKNNAIAIKAIVKK